MFLEVVHLKYIVGAIVSNVRWTDLSEANQILRLEFCGRFLNGSKKRSFCHQLNSNLE